MPSIPIAILMIMGLVLLLISLALRIVGFIRWRLVHEWKDRRHYVRAIKNGGFALMWILQKDAKKYEEIKADFDKNMKELEKGQVEIVISEMDAMIEHEEQGLEFLDRVLSLVFTSGAFLVGTGLALWSFSDA